MYEDDQHIIVNMLKEIAIFDSRFLSTQFLFFYQTTKIIAQNRLRN